MTNQQTTNQPTEPVGPPKQETAPPSKAWSSVATAWRYKSLLPIALWTTLTYYTVGPIDETWQLPVALFVSLYKGLSSIGSSARSDGAKRDAAASLIATRRSLDNLVPRLPQPPYGFAVDVTIPVLSRGLKGELEPFDRLEDGSRTLEAEWDVGRDLYEDGFAGGVEGAKRPKRVLLYFHGGAYALLNKNFHRALVTRLSQETGFPALSVNYRLCPEAIFPAALHDAVAAYQYLTLDLGVPASAIVLGGDSAGGGLCSALMVYLRDAGLPMVGGAILISPWVDLTASLRSWVENKAIDYISDGRRLDETETGRESIPALYVGQDNFPHKLNNTCVSAVLADLSGLPPLLIQSGAVEVLRDEHTLLAQRAARAGVKVTHEILGGGIHVPHSFRSTPIAKAALARIGTFARSLGAPAEPLPSQFLDVLGGTLEPGWAAYKARMGDKLKPRRPRAEGAKAAGGEAEYDGWRVAEVRKQPPTVVLRDDGGVHEAARRVVEENARHEHADATWLVPERVAQAGLVGKLRGVLHL